jgi:diaminopimelate epimerase
METYDSGGGGFRLQFTKMNGAGNDFIILNNLVEKLSPEALPNLARVLCNRHLSIGADGLMAVDRAEGGADFKMRFYNSDGSAGEMCGNGARCICRYGYEHGLAGERQTIETPAGIVTGERIDARNYRIRLNSPTTVHLDECVELDGRRWKLSYVELGCPGLPHAAVEYPGLASADERSLFDLGRALRYHPAFPKGANVNFYELTGPDELLEKTYERGVEDFTYACGTGTGSVVTALTLLGRVSGRGVRVRMAGGVLTVDVEHDAGAVQNLYLTGPTNLVAAGEVLDEALI